MEKFKITKNKEEGRELINWYERMQNLTIGESPKIKEAISVMMEGINKLGEADKKQVLDRLEKIIKDEEDTNEGGLEEVVERINRELDSQNLE